MPEDRVPKTKIAITLDPGVLARLDSVVEKAGFPSRSRAVARFSLVARRSGA